MDVYILQGMTRDQVASLLRGIHQAFDEHVRWLCQCQQALMHPERIHPSLIEVDAHHFCKFGRWYYGPVPAHIKSSEAFTQLGQLHLRVHDCARSALGARLERGELDEDLCEAFISAQSDFLIALNHYVTEIAGGGQLFDPLTGLLNRLEMFPLLKKEQARVERTGQKCTLALADLDHFKRINDTYGHEAGDSVLTGAAKVFKSNLRPYDLLFRYGGEEFLFCLPDTDADEAGRIVERMRVGIEQTAFVIEGAGTAKITVSFGLSPLVTGADVGRSVHMADDALYDAKKAGRNRVCIKPED